MLLEADSKAQIARNTGGPKDPDLLMACVDLEKEFPNCDGKMLQAQPYYYQVLPILQILRATYGMSFDIFKTTLPIKKRRRERRREKDKKSF